MSSESSNGSNGLGDTGTVVLEDKPDLKEPPMYQVVLLNDDFTPMEFVVYILQAIFGYEHERSTQIMLAVHTKGKGVWYDVNRTKNKVVFDDHCAISVLKATHTTS